MTSKRPLMELGERKRLLLLQADLHRAVFHAECVNARARLGWLNEVRDKARVAGPWVAVGAAAIGLLAARRWRGLMRWIPAALAAARWVRKMRSG